MRRVTNIEASERFNELLATVEHGGDEVVITRNGQPVAILHPLATREEPAVQAAEKAPDDGESLCWVPDCRGRD